MYIQKRENPIVNRLNKTKVERIVDHEEERQERIKKENAVKRAAAAEKVRQRACFYVRKVTDCQVSTCRKKLRSYLLSSARPRKRRDLTTSYSKVMTRRTSRGNPSGRWRMTSCDSIYVPVPIQQPRFSVGSVGSIRFFMRLDIQSTTTHLNRQK